MQRQQRRAHLDIVGEVGTAGVVLGVAEAAAGSARSRSAQSAAATASASASLSPVAS